jgi:hypothetical protein
MRAVRRASAVTGSTGISNQPGQATSFKNASTADADEGGGVLTVFSSGIYQVIVIVSRDGDVVDVVVPKLAPVNLALCASATLAMYFQHSFHLHMHFCLACWGIKLTFALRRRVSKYVLSIVTVVAITGGLYGWITRDWKRGMR